MQAVATKLIKMLRRLLSISTRSSVQIKANLTSFVAVNSNVTVCCPCLFISWLCYTRCHRVRGNTDNQLVELHVNSIWRWDSWRCYIAVHTLHHQVGPANASFYCRCRQASVFCSVVERASWPWLDFEWWLCNSKSLYVLPLPPVAQSVHGKALE